MATGGGLALPEPLVDEEGRSWFKRYEVCATANGWNDKKAASLTYASQGAFLGYLRLIARGGNGHMKAAILKRLCPDTEEDRVQSIARAFEHCVIRCGLRNVSYWCIFNHVTRLYDLIFINLPCEPGKKGACPYDWITQQITQCTHVQTHMQSTVVARERLSKRRLRGHADVDLKVQKCPCVKHGNDLGKYSHVINMGLF